MTLVEFLVLLLIAGIAGALGQAIVGAYAGGGFLVSVVIGFIGASIGVWLARNLGLPELFSFDIGGTSFPFLWSVLGSAVLIAIISFFARN